MSSAQPLNLGTDDEGKTILAVPYDGDGEFANSITSQLNTSSDSPVPAGDGGPGPIQRITDQFSAIPGGLIRRIIMAGGESAEAIRTRRDELYRNAFPRIVPRYAHKCGECDSEFDTEHDECPACGSTDLSKPDPEKKRKALRLFESVNAAGQTLRDVAKRAEEDQQTAGVSTLVVEYDYYQASEPGLFREGEIYRKEPVGLHRADPFKLRPVVDENGHPGGYAYTCPLHRDVESEEPGRCKKCGAELKEVHFVEKNDGDEIPYLREEVITWSWAYPRLHGLDGIAPASHVWIKQAILHMMDRYAGAFYDPESDRLPNQFMILHTSNPDSWEEEMAKARGDSDQYRSPVFTNEYAPQDSVQPEVQVIDAMPDELLGQSEETKSQFKKDIRQAFGIMDVHDSDLEDAGGLNNEGLQLEVIDRSLASQMNDYRQGWLDTLMKRFGFDGWEIAFLPDTGADPDSIQDNLRAAAFVKQAGGDAEIVDGRLEITDFEVDLDDSDDPPSLEGQPNLPGVGSPVPEGGAGGGGGAPGGGAGGAGGLDTSSLQAEVSALESMETKARWGIAVGMKGAPVYSQREDVPTNVQNRIEGAIAAHDFSLSNEVSSRVIKRVFEKSLTQPQGWSIDSIANNLMREADVEPTTARTIAQSEATAVLNSAREDAVGELDEVLDDEVLHYWDGPDDDDTTEMCTWLKEETNPEYGGDPVPMEQLKRLQREAIDRFGDDDPDSRKVRDHVLHPNERHTHRSILRNEL